MKRAIDDASSEDIDSAIMSDSLSPAPDDQELELAAPHVEDDDDGISSDSSGSVPGSVIGDAEDGDVVTICRWDYCGQDMRTLDALVRHVHDCKNYLP
jgi:hypothetical protein